VLHLFFAAHEEVDDLCYARLSRNPRAGSPQRPQSSQRRAETFFSVVSVHSVLHLFFAAHEEVDDLCYGAAEPQPKSRLTTEATEFAEKSRNIFLCGLRALCAASSLRRPRRSSRFVLQQDYRPCPDPEIGTHTGRGSQRRICATRLTLLANAVLVWSTVRMDEIVSQLQASGEEVQDEARAHVSPLA
jgi:hypothetical protein